jgi:hypothetical protein
MFDSCPPATGSFWNGPIFAAMLAGGAAIVSSAGLRYLELSDTGRLLMALLVLPPSMMFVRAMHRYVASLDELQQRIQVEALAISFSCTIVLLLTVEYVQKAGFARSLDWDFAWGAMAGMYLAARYFVARRYT